MTVFHQQALGEVMDGMNSPSIGISNGLEGLMLCTIPVP